MPLRNEQLQKTTASFFNGPFKRIESFFSRLNGRFYGDLGRYGIYGLKSRDCIAFQLL